ncbi:MAG TPA: hypothetical protein VIY90_19975 [Steroidobacteraceae bacterium]|jgi:hypothetical protein
MFVITEADAAAIRATFNQEGELSAAIELRRRGSPTTRRRGMRPEHHRMDRCQSRRAR